MFCRWGPVDNTGVLTIHFPVMYNITDFAAQRHHFANYLSFFTLQYTRDGVTWLDHVTSEGEAIECPVVDDVVEESFMAFRDVIIARGLRIRALSHVGYIPYLRLELFGYPYGTLWPGCYLYSACLNHAFVPLQCS